MPDHAGTKEDQICAALDSWKRAGRNDTITVRHPDGTAVGVLQPVTRGFNAAVPDACARLTKWRIENAHAFAARFEITEERTRIWLEKLVLGRRDRMLFFINDLQGHAVGHAGVSSFDFEADSCELDNVVRGVPGVCPGIMQAAVLAVVEWAVTVLGVKSVRLRVLSDNEHAAAFYYKCGFVKQDEIPLFRREEGKETYWDEEDGPGKTPDRSYIVMKYQPKGNT